MAEILTGNILVYWMIVVPPDLQLLKCIVCPTMQNCLLNFYLAHQYCHSFSFRTKSLWFCVLLVFWLYKHTESPPVSRGSWTPLIQKNTVILLTTLMFYLLISTKNRCVKRSFIFLIAFILQVHGCKVELTLCIPMLYYKKNKTM